MIKICSPLPRLLHKYHYPLSVQTCLPCYLVDRTPGFAFQYGIKLLCKYQGFTSFSLCAYSLFTEWLPWELMLGSLPLSHLVDSSFCCVWRGLLFIAGHKTYLEASACPYNSCFFTESACILCIPYPVQHST